MWKIVATIVHLIPAGGVTYYSPTDRFSYQDQCTAAMKVYQGHKANVVAESYYRHKVRVTLRCKLDNPRA